MNDLTTSTIRDSTANANHGAKKGANEPIEADGKIGKAQGFDGTDDFFSAADADSLDVSGAITVEAWVRYDDKTNFRNILSKGSSWGDVTNYFAGLYKQEFYFEFFAAGVRRSYRTVPIPDIGTWVHFAGIYDGAERARIYQNGDLVLTGSDIGALVLNTNPAALFVGKASNGYPYDGLIDEVRISSVARSAAWLKFEYHNMAEADNELTWGAEEDLSPMVVSATGVVENLNADMLDGHHAADFALVSHTHPGMITGDYDPEFKALYMSPK